VTLGLPAKLTAATGMDAWRHNLEAYWHAASTIPWPKPFARKGIAAGQEYLGRAPRPTVRDVEARQQMLVSVPAWGAVAFQPWPGCHSLRCRRPWARSMTETTMALLNAIMMPYDWQANRAAIEPESCACHVIWICDSRF